MVICTPMPPSAGGSRPNPSLREGVRARYGTWADIVREDGPGTAGSKHADEDTDAQENWHFDPPELFRALGESMDDGVHR